MKILFAGTPDIAVPALKAVHEHFPVCGVLTSPDQRAGRGNSLIFSAVKTAALDLYLPVLQPEKVDETFINQVKALKPDILVVAAYGKIFRENFLKLFPLGGINFHPSLLPEFRGPSPIPATILAGKTEGGVTIQQLALEMDAGDILLQEKVQLTGRETTESLTKAFALTGAGMLITVLNAIKAREINPLSQNHKLASYCKLIKKEQGLINWEEPAVIIERKIRAFYPWPAAFTFFLGKRLVIHEAILYSTDNTGTGIKCGYVMDADKECGLLVNTGKGILGLKIVQLQTKKSMDFKSFLNGYKDIINYTLGV